MSLASTIRFQGSALREEPFRIFFPLAILATIAGVALWPLFHYGLLSIYPHIMHARVMTVGLAGILFGFLGTAFPRLIDAPPPRGVETASVLLLWLASLSFYLLNRTPIADALFALASATLAASLAIRWYSIGRDTPPPGMPVALVGLLSGAIAAAALAWKRGMWMSPFEFQLAQLLLYQGMALLCLLGVGPYLLPRLLGHESKHRFEDSPVPPAAWWRPFGISVALGLTVHASFLIEAGGAARWGMALRSAAILTWMIIETPLLRRANALTTSGTASRVAVISCAVALAWAGFDLDRRIGILHLLFVSGLGLVMLGIGVRVTLGHAGRHDLLSGKITWLRIVIALALLAASTRVSADFLPHIRISHLNYAGGTWIIIAILWLWKLGRWFPKALPMELPSKCPKSRTRSRSTEPHAP